MPKFSIIIPVYNVAPYLRECLDSVCAAVEKVKVGGEGERWIDSPSVEVICVDDGSTDGSGEILDEYAARFNSSTFQPFNLSTFRIVHRRNAGAGAARNAGLELVSGEWIVFLDSDDLLGRQALVTFVECSKAYPDADILRYEAKEFADGENPNPGDDSASRISCTDIRLAIGARELDETCWKHAFRRSKCGDVRFEDYSMGEDRLFLLRCLVRTGMVATSSRVGYFYRIWTGSAMHRRPTVRHILGNMGFAKSYLETLRGSGRKVNVRDCREFGSIWFERCVAEMFGLPGSERATVWNAWRKALPEARGLYAYFTPWRKLMVAVCGRLPFMPVAWLLGALPHKLKLAGFHRRRRSSCES